MKIAVSSQGTSPASAVDPRLGRASYFLVTSDDGATWQVLDHSTTAAEAQGAGIQTAQKLLDAGIEVVLTGHIGPKAFSVLQSGSMQMYGNAQGTVTEALAAYRQGTLTRLDTSDVKGHWGKGQMGNP